MISFWLIVSACSLCDDTALDCLVAHCLHVDSVTVIANLDDDIVAFLECVEENKPDFRYLPLQYGLRCLQVRDPRNYEADVQKRVTDLTTTVRSSSVFTCHVQFHLLCPAFWKDHGSYAGILQLISIGTIRTSHHGLMKIGRDTLQIFNLLMKDWFLKSPESVELIDTRLFFCDDKPRIPGSSMHPASISG